MKHMGPAADAAAAGGRQHMAAAGPDSKSDTSENVAIGFAFNALSTIFVMLMASCAKLAGGYPARAMVPPHYDAMAISLQESLVARESRSD
jgi:hypothetical protein